MIIIRLFIMNIDKEHENKLTTLKNRCSYANSYVSLVQQLVQSTELFSWKLLQYLLTNAQTKDRAHYLQLKMEVERSYRNIRTFTMLIYFYFLKDTKKQFTFSYANWRLDYLKFVENMNAFSLMLTTNQNSLIFQETLWLLIKTFPRLITNQFITFGETQLINIIQWVTYFKTPDAEVQKYNDVCQLVKMVKQVKTTTLNIQNKMQHVVFKKLIQIVCQVKNASPNIFLFVYPILLPNQQVNYFCQIYSDFITDLGEEAILNFFAAITKSSLTKQILFFIKGVSIMLKNQQQFFKLRFLYQNFILPILIKRSKLCKKVQDLVYQISSLYVLGFLKHCDIGVSGISCITKNIGRIKNYDIKQKWINLCKKICNYYPDLQPQMGKLLQGQLNQVISLKQLNSIEQENQQQIWDITIRNGRKRKKYVKVHSKMRGITNRKNQCYIISTIQGIQKIQLFQKLLDRFRDDIKGKLIVLDQLRMLFNQISGHRKAQKITISYLKKMSSSQFVASENQEDACQYLQKLFDLIEQQTKNSPEIQKQFKSIFQAKEVITVVCKNCNNRNERKSNTYIHKIPYTEVLSQVSKEQLLIDYKCENCNSISTCVSSTQITPGKVFIVFITRLAKKQDKIVKQLSTQRICRDFMSSYELVGMVSHKGRSVNHGHYVYFHRINPKRWAEFNDNQVTEFELEQPHEQFESEWKAQMTPYMLFYKIIENK